MLISRTFPLLILVTLLISPTRVGAEDRTGTFSMGLTPSYAYVVLDGGQAEPDGGGAALFLGYAITEAMEVRLSGLWSGHVISATDKSPELLLQVFNLAVIFSYAFDLAPVRPTLEAGIGLLHQRLGDQAVSSVSLQVGVGADYSLLPWLEIGAVFHYHAFLQSPDQLPVYFDVGPRITFRIR